MTRKAREGNFSNDNYRSISPLKELHFLDAMMADHELSMTARVVGYLLVRWTNGDKSHRFHGYAWAPRNTLADWIGRDSETTITTATNALKARGWIIVRRRPNASSLIRPNWDRIGQQQDLRESQKTAFLEDQFSVHPEDQKIGPNSADHDSAYQDSVSFPNASHRGRQTPLSEEAPPAQAGMGNEKPAPYRQTKAEADQALETLRSMPFCTEWDDPAFELSHDAATAEAVHWHKLLKSGIASSRIVRAAERFLIEAPGDQLPSLAGFLARYAWDCIEPDCDLYTPPDDEEPAAANDNQLSPERKVSGIDWENDPPF